MAASALALANQKLHQLRNAQTGDAAPCRPTQSTALAHANQKLQQQRETHPAAPPHKIEITILPDPPHPSSFIPHPSVIPTYPDINNAALLANETKLYRCWLLLHHHFNRVAGRQRIHDREAREIICTGENAVCSDRYWRMLRNAGDGSYWSRGDDNQLWIYGATDVALHLNVERVQQNRIAIQERDLRGAIGTVRASLYATFHAARDATPISRDTLTDLSGLSRPTMLRYERVSKTDTTANYELLTPQSDAENAFWRYKQAAFKFYDAKGKQGKKGQSYIARQLPNSYRNDMQRLPRGRRRKVNRQLRDRVISGRTAIFAAEQRYHPDGASAANAINRGADHASYPAHVDGATDQFWNNIFLWNQSDQTVRRFRGLNSCRQGRLLSDT